MAPGNIDIKSARRTLLTPPVLPPFDPAELDEFPEPVRRYFNAAIAPGAAVATAASFRMTGRIKLKRWVPFRADEVLSPRRGFVWQAWAAGVISGFDAYTSGQAAMEWKVLGLVPVMRAQGKDIAKSAAGRCGGESIWVPTALLPRFDVRWAAVAPDHLVAAFPIGTTQIELHLRIASDGRLMSVVFDRWGDPDETGTFAMHPFGGEVSDHQTFDGITVPVAGSWGWHYRTDQWHEGEFFRCRLTDYLPG